MNLICLLKNRDYECIIYILKNMETITKSFQANKQNNGQLILSLYLFSSDNVETKQANKIYEYFTKLFNDLRMQTENHASYDENNIVEAVSGCSTSAPAVDTMSSALWTRPCVDSKASINIRASCETIRISISKCRLLSSCNETH